MTQTHGSGPVCSSPAGHVHYASAPTTCTPICQPEEGHVTQTQYVVKIPTIKGQNICTARKSVAEREVRAAARAGHAATILEVLIRR